MVDFAIGPTRPDLTVLLRVAPEVAAARRRERVTKEGVPTDRFEEAGGDFFARVEAGFAAVAAAEPERVRIVDASPSVEEVAAAVWEVVRERWGWETSGTRVRVRK